MSVDATRDPKTTSGPSVLRRLLVEPQRRSVVDWLLSKGFVDDLGSLVIAWSCRSGYDSVFLEFQPLSRRAGDTGWDAVVGHHASGTNPRLGIGRCETLEDVQMVCETIRKINGYEGPEPWDRW